MERPSEPTASEADAGKSVWSVFPDAVHVVTLETWRLGVLKTDHLTGPQSRKTDTSVPDDRLDHLDTF